MRLVGPNPAALDAHQPDAGRVQRRDANASAPVPTEPAAAAAAGRHTHRAAVVVPESAERPGRTVLRRSHQSISGLREAAWGEQYTAASLPPNMVCEAMIM